MSHKIVLHVPEYNACAFYRLIMPLNQCYSDLSKKGIYLFQADKVSYNERVDTYVFSRIIKRDLYNFAYTAKCNGAKIVWSTDDNLFEIPSWNPAGEKISENDLRSTIDFIELSDALLVSTEPLADSLSLYNKNTYVCPNLIDLCHFNEREVKTSNKSQFKYNQDRPVEILWAGGSSHDQDLQQIVKPVIKLIEKYGEKVHFTFMGYIPDGLCEYIRFPGRNYANIKSKYEKNIAYMTDVPLRLYYETLEYLAPDIGIAPLCDCKFNKSKSAIKSYEMILSGGAFVGTNYEPYSWVKHNETGLLVNVDNEEGWIDYISELIENKTKRDKLYRSGRKELIKNHSWQSEEKKKIWLDTFEEIINI